ncbi:MAG: hypothetical protein Unbinned6316contig1000_32 [Prokaryotic dsDNA virus sp.]|nr:MAG: hypothetical protein Unbinned6316contig1000_32 [Prokaryotic dsDNA virus sp.]
MYSTFKMKEATNAEEAKVSILNVIDENPLWLNKVTDSLVMLLKEIEPENRKFLLDKSLDEKIIDLFVKIKTQYYHYKDVTRWNY